MKKKIILFRRSIYHLHKMLDDDVGTDGGDDIRGVTWHDVA